MSCIVGLVDHNKVWVGCDSMSSDETVKLVRKDDKFFRPIENAVIGFSGSYRAGQILRCTKGLLTKRSKCDEEYLIRRFIPKIEKVFDKRNNNELECPFLLAFENRLFQVDVDFQLAESATGYDAVGSGSYYALGSLSSTEEFKISPEERIYLALKAAEIHGRGVGRPFHILNTHNTKEIVYET